MYNFFSPLLADTKQYPAFVGHKPGRNNTQRHRLDIQLIMIMNRTLYIAARWVMIAVSVRCFLNLCFLHTEGILRKYCCSFRHGVEFDSTTFLCGVKEQSN